jgi:soluble lytic murein transglycosylase-like protein
MLLMVAGATRADIFVFTDERGIAHFSNVPNDPRYEVLLRTAPAVSQAGARIDARLLSKVAQYDSLIETAAARTALEPQLLQAVIVVESGFDPAAVSAKGARGLMQLMPATARAYGATDLGDPAQNVAAGARYLRSLIDRYENDLELALAAYNAGEDAVRRSGRKIPPYRETQRYVPKVMQVYRALREQPRTG